ncbi:hypothetical protein [Sporolactobacillus sp. KGMB 08714]|uniref:hypothetical protein n=1 Tax=Sporolactobacillus sp. KGMB 08714 TaxID=3064704 RepID=UPI002FBE099C
METTYFDLSFNQHGALTRLTMKNDPHHMNWVIDPDYLKQVGYRDADKLFGEFNLTVDHQSLSSIHFQPVVESRQERTTVTFSFGRAAVRLTYRPGLTDETLDWSIELINHSNRPLLVDHFAVWVSLAYIMFRDQNVLRNMNDSAAVFPSISADFTKLAAVRRSGKAPHLGVYQLSGKTLSVGTYCEYTNRFFENVSPSLDGMLFHQLILAGGYHKDQQPPTDWIYNHDGLILSPGETKQWRYRLCTLADRNDFYARAMAFGHPIIRYQPMIKENEQAQLTLTMPENITIRQVHVSYRNDDRLISEDVSRYIEQDGRNALLAFPAQGSGEHKITITFDNGKQDCVVFNVVRSLRQMLDERVDYISNTLYQGADAKVPFSFIPLSNQGESLGKLSLVLQKNLLDQGHLNSRQIRQVEASAVNYVRPKWFINGDFRKPRKLYGNFYRVMDFEYIGHMFFLLSKFDNTVLKLHHADDYLQWAADIFNLRVNPALHDDPRAQSETQMLGVFFLYINDLLSELKQRGLTDKYATIKKLWEQIADKVDRESETYRAAVTEHYYDNAGFGPAAGALSNTGHTDGARRYSRLLEANIGFSNDFRAQAPDRWWEALSYMMHALWGGIVSAAMLQAYDFLKDSAYLEAAYRSTVAMLYCYDTQATATGKLEKGAAASTYSIAGPNLNRPDLSRQRFGQSAFASDGGIFTRLFPEGDTGHADWDMGEELVAYLNGFGCKTYLYTRAGQLRVINGRLEANSDGSYTIFSFAPYPREYIFTEQNLHYTTPEGILAPVVKFIDHQFVRA